MDDVLQLARDLIAGPLLSNASVAAIGVGVCELVDHDGRMASANCIPWLDIDVREELSAIAPAVIEADVRAAALAEAAFGAGHGCGRFLYVTVGTGISCSLVLDGVPDSGTHGATGTMASSPLSIPCEACGHVSRRTLEDISAGPALVRRFAAAGGAAATAREVLAAALAGDPRALGVIHSGAEALGSQIGLLINVLDPSAIIIGGGLGLSEGPYYDTVVAATRRHVWSPALRELPISRAATGADAGWIGAAAAAARKYHLKLQLHTTTP